MGSEYVMEAEVYFNRGDFENAEIAAHKARFIAEDNLETNSVICALFLHARLNVVQGNYSNILPLFEKMRKQIKQECSYAMLYTLDMCIGFINANLNQTEKVPEWLSEGRINSSRLYFQAYAFANIIYGRLLIIRGEYLKLIGVGESFINVASIFPNLLSIIYTKIYLASANEQIFRREEALILLKQAIELAMPDQLYMPFVENCDYIKDLIQELYHQGVYQDDLSKILELNHNYRTSLQKIAKAHFAMEQPKLTVREREVAQLAAEGYSNKGICELLFVSENTVKKHLKSIYEKLNVNSRSLLKHHLKNIYS